MRRRIVGLLTLVCLVAVALVAASSLWAAGGPAPGAQGGGLRPLTADELARHDQGPPPDGQPSGASAAAGARRFRDSGPGRQQRAASREAFRGLSGSGALAVSREKHPELAGALPPRMKLSGRVLRYLDGGTSALVAGSKGSRGVVQSTMPLRATTASGVPAPVDAALTDRGDRFAAVNPATPIEFPKQADGRIRIGALGVGLEPAGGSGPGVLRDGKVFYANTAKDADTTLLSLPTGAESFTELRSPASPEEIRLGFDLPAGQTLRASSAPHMSAEIVSGKKVIADVSAPTAYDAQKQSLPVTSTIQGSTLVLHVAHRSLDVAYPIVVDPQIGVLEPDGWYWIAMTRRGGGPISPPGARTGSCGVRSGATDRSWAHAGS